MTLRAKGIAALVATAFIGSSGLLLRAQAPQAVGTWAPAGELVPSHSGAAAVALEDGRTLIVGGADADGTPTDLAVIVNPRDNSLVTAGQLLRARVGHTATLLVDGRVLVAGGTVDGAPSPDLEVLDLDTGGSTLVGALGQPRSGHAAARLADGTVLIAGGSTLEGAVLGTAESFDPQSGSVALLPSALQSPRAGASATLLIDGRVLVAGGTNGTTDLSSAEIYDPAAYTFTLLGTELSVARSGHAAVLLPHNNSVLIAGGRSSGVVQTAVDLYLPAEFPDPYSYGTGTFAGTTAMVNARVGAVGAPGHADGFAFVTGGGTEDEERYRFATIKTDKDDYAPGERAVITGSGWQAGEDVRLVFQEDPAVHDDYVLTVTADENGNIYWDQWSPEEHDLNVRFYLMARDSRSRAQVTFTDGQLSNNGVSVTPTSVTVAAGQTAVYTTKVSFGGNTDPCAVNLTITTASGQTGLPAATAPLFAPSQVIGAGGTTQPSTLSITTSSATVPGTYTFTVTGTSGTACQNARTENAAATLIIAPSYSISDVTANEGNSGTTVYTFTVTKSSGTAASSVHYSTADATATGGSGCATGADYVAVPDTTLNFSAGQTSRPVQITVCGDTAFESDETFFLNLSNPSAPTAISDGQGVGTITNDDPAPTATALMSSATPSVFGQSVTFTATVTVVSPAVGTPTGTVEFFDGATSLGSAALNASGVALLSTSTLTVGTHSLTAKYLGDGDSGESTSPTVSQVVNKRATSTTVTSSVNPSVFGEQVTFTATLAGTGAGAGDPGNQGAVQFKIDGVNAGAAVALSGNQATLVTSSLTTGTHTVEAGYSGATNFEISTGTLTGGQVVNKRTTATTVTSNVNPSTFGQEVTYTAVVAGTGAGAGNPADQGTVQFTIGGVNVGAAVALGGNQATLVTSSLTAGTHTVQAVYSGATNFATSTGTLTGGQVVNKRATATTVISSLNPSTFGENVTFTATVAGSGAGAGSPGDQGTVQFSIDGVHAGAAVPLSGNQATFATSSLTAGTHTVHAVYSGATNFETSTGTLTGGQVVNKRATATTVTASVNPSIFRQQVTFTAMVTGTGPGTGNPADQGTVQFLIDGVNAGAAVALSGNQATLVTSSLTAGTHTVHAVYSGATNFETSTGTLTGGQVVLKRTTTTTVMLNPSSLFVNQASTVSVTVTDVAAAGAASNPGVGTVVMLSSSAPEAIFAGTCTLAAVSPGTNQSSCQATVTPASAGTRSITATFVATLVHETSSGSALLTANLRTTGNVVAVATTPISEGSSVLISATVSDLAGAGTAIPSGVVTFMSGVATDAFTLASSCTLMPSGMGTATCSVTISAPDDRAPGALPYSGSTVHAVTGTYVPGGSSVNVHAASYGMQGLTVSNVAPVVAALSGLPPVPVALGSVDATVTLVSTNFTDPGILDTHESCSVNWGDEVSETPPETLSVTETAGTGTGSCASATHTYMQSGVFTVTVTVADDDGAIGTSRFEYVVVYPPGGHVTGGGWINSPAGAYVHSPNLTGKANFGFVSKYKKGQSIPDGATEFQFKAGNLDFHSTSYEWLVVSGARAQFFGSGQIKGTSLEYWFKLTAIDGQISGGGGSDKFRIKIWEKTDTGGDGPVIYDNQMGMDENGNASTVLAGGSIVLHSPK